MKIKDWQHAIDLAIERYKYALENNISVFEAEIKLKPDDWITESPLCEYIFQVYGFDEDELDDYEGELCEDCLWKQLEDVFCLAEPPQEAIQRLEIWKQRLGDNKMYDIFVTPAIDKDDLE